MVSIVEDSSKEMGSSLHHDKEDPPRHPTGTTETSANGEPPGSSKAAVPTRYERAPVPLPREGSENSFAILSRPISTVQQEESSSSSNESNASSAESLCVIEMSDDEAAEEEASVDRRAELVRQRSSRRRLGELNQEFFVNNNESATSVESLAVIDMSNNEAAEQEASVDRRAELVRRRSSLRRLGELNQEFFDSNNESATSVESLGVIDMSNNEAAEQEAVVDRRAELLRRRSSLRRLGELKRAIFDENNNNVTTNEDPTASSIEPSSHREFSAHYSSDDEASGSSAEIADESRQTFNAKHPNATEGDLYLLAQAFLRGVVCLQARVRRYIAYRKFQSTLRAIRKLQAWVRPKAQRVRQEHLARETEPAVILQAVVRGFLARRACSGLVNYVETQLAALIIQKWWQLVHLDPKAGRAARRIQTVFRAYTTKEFYILQRFAATLIQAQVRGQQRRKRYRRMKVQPSNSDTKDPLTQLQASANINDSDASTDLVDDPLGRDYDEISMPPLMDMDPPSESNYAYSEPSDSSSTMSEVNSTQITVKMSNTATRKKREKISDSSDRGNELIPVKETPVWPIEDDVKPSPKNATNELQALPTDDTAAAARCVAFTRTPRPPPPPPVSPPSVSFPKKTENHPKFEEETPQKQLRSAMDQIPSDEILPPSPAKTEVDIDDFDQEFEDPFAKGTNSSSILMVLLVISCFVLPVVLFFDEVPSGFAGSKKAARMAAVKVPETATPASSKREQQKVKETIRQMEKPEQKMMNKAMALVMEKRQSSPKSQASHATVPTVIRTSSPVNVDQPVSSQRGGATAGNVPVVTIHTPSSASMHAMVISTREKGPFNQLAAARLNFGALGGWIREIHGRVFESNAPPPAKVEVTVRSQLDGSSNLFPMQRTAGVVQPATSPTRKEMLPLSFIHLSSSGTFHATEIVKREKAISRREIHLVSVQAVGDWVKGIRKRFFETDAAEPTQVEVTGWLHVDGRGLFSNKLELKGPRAVRETWDAIHLEDHRMKVAKDADLSLVTEWGLALTSISRKKKD